MSVRYCNIEMTAVVVITVERLHIDYRKCRLDTGGTAVFVLFFLIFLFVSLKVQVNTFPVEE